MLLICAVVATTTGLITSFELPNSTRACLLVAAFLVSFVLVSLVRQHAVPDLNQDAGLPTRLLLLVYALLVLLATLTALSAWRLFLPGCWC